MSCLATSKAVGVVGAGTMGAGIAQLAAAAGHDVILFDVAAGAAAKGKSRLLTDLRKLAERGKVTLDEIDRIDGRIRVAERDRELADVGLVIEAILEDLDAKRLLFARLEGIVGPEAALATNTSSISVTAIGRDLKRPERLVGMHFFNPAPVMRLVEVVSGVATSRAVAETVFATAEAWGKIAVHARSTPGFIVNRVARAYYAEAMRLCEEQVADPATIDALLTEGAGFRMGPFELMDLIGHDVNYAVSLSVYNAFHQEPRFRPSNLQLELVNASHLGRKTGRGFYRYDGAPRPSPLTEPVGVTARLIGGFVYGEAFTGDGLRIVPTDGRTARARAAEAGDPTIVYDLAIPANGSGRVGFSASLDVSASSVADFVATLAAAGMAATRLPDWPGLVVMRTVAMIANEAFETVLQGVAAENHVDAAMRYGVNYPRGPVEWARDIGPARVLAVLDAIHELTGDPRYRASLGLRFATQP